MPERLTIGEVCADLDLPDDVLRFEHAPCEEVLFGEGALENLGEKTRKYGKRVLLVTDPGIVAAGIVERAVGILKAAGLEVGVFDKVHENPTTADVAACVDAARDYDTDVLVGLGGGSSMDAAKGTNFILSNGGEMRNYWGKNKAEKPMLPFVAVPTTTGTGSECQSFALISDAVTHQKMACGDKKVAARVAILDPVLTLTLPARVTALSGIDAISHAIESHVSKAGTPVSRKYSMAAFHMLRLGAGQVAADPGDLMGRSRMLLGAALAGTAIENSMLGAAHSASNPLTAHFDIVHGQAVGAMLPTVIRWNAARSEEAARRYAELMTPEELALWTEDCLRNWGLAPSLAELDIDGAMIPILASEAAGQWTAQFNPVPVEGSDLARIYELAMGGE